MSMTLDYLPTDVSPTIKDECGEVRLVGRKADVDFLCPDDGFGSQAARSYATTRTATVRRKAADCTRSELAGNGRSRTIYLNRPLLLHETTRNEPTINGKVAPLEKILIEIKTHGPVWH
jgi:hypothetical protein